MLMMVLVPHVVFREKGTFRRDFGCVNFTVIGLHV